jgi:hypothetical protein
MRAFRERRWAAWFDHAAICRLYHLPFTIFDHSIILDCRYCLPNRDEVTRRRLALASLRQRTRALQSELSALTDFEGASVALPVALRAAASYARTKQQQQEPEHIMPGQLPDNGNHMAAANDHTSAISSSSSSSSSSTTAATTSSSSSSSSSTAIDTALLDRWASDADASIARLSAAIAEHQRAEATFFDDMRADEFAYVLRYGIVSV